VPELSFAAKLTGGMVCECKPLKFADWLYVTAYAGSMGNDLKIRKNLANFHS
jgi:hypothetical protein